MVANFTFQLYCSYFHWQSYDEAVRTDWLTKQRDYFRFWFSADPIRLAHCEINHAPKFTKIYKNIKELHKAKENTGKLHIFSTSKATPVFTRRSAP